MQAIEEEREQLLKLRQNLDPQKLVALTSNLNSLAQDNTNKDRPRSREFRIKNGANSASQEKLTAQQTPEDQPKHSKKPQANMEDAYMLTKKQINDQINKKMAQPQPSSDQDPEQFYNLLDELKALESQGKTRAMLLLIKSILSGEFDDRPEEETDPLKALLPNSKLVELKNRKKEPKKKWN